MKLDESFFHGGQSYEDMFVVYYLLFVVQKVSKVQDVQKVTFYSETSPLNELNTIYLLNKSFFITQRLIQDRAKKKNFLVPNI